MTADDLAVAAGGFFGVRRGYGSQSSAPFDGPVGFNWWVNQLPVAVGVGASTVAIVFTPNQMYWFDRSGSSFVPRYSFQRVTLVENTSAQTLTFAKTDGTQADVTVFNSLAATSNPGAFVSHTDARGVKTVVASQTGAQVNELQRSYTIGTTAYIDSLVYTYVTSGAAAGKLQSVTYRQQIGGGGWAPLRQVSYAYYGSSDPNDNANDLRSATQQLPDGSGGWQNVAVDYYRYYVPGAAHGFAHAMKMHFGPEAYRLMFNAGIDPTTASDAALMPYVDHYFEYDPSAQRVTKEVGSVCASCPGGGTTTDQFAYSSNPRSVPPGFNTWATKTVQTLPDGSSIVVYTNYAGMPMVYANVDAAGTSRWITYYRYGTDGQRIWKAHPSAVNGYDDAYDDLMNFGSGGTSPYLNNGSGLIEVTDYYPTTDLPNGKVQGYVSTQSVQQGQGGTPVAVRSYTYTSNTAGGVTTYPVATETVYPVAGSTATMIVTRYAYTWYAGTNVVQQKTTTLPAVSAAQNGDGTAPTVVEQYDPFGYVTRRTDERGTVTTFAYNALGQVTQQVLNVQSGVTQPGVNVTTDYAYDTLGRPTQTLSPSHTVVLAGVATTVRRATWNAYVQSAQPASGTWDVDQTWTGSGYATGSAPGYTYTLVDPVTILKADKDGRTTDQITSKRTVGSGALSPTDTFAQTDWRSWSSTQYNAQHQKVSDRRYFLIPASGTGSAGTNYGQTDYAYDALERLNRVRASGGTITRTVWAAPQRVASVWVGTDDTGAIDSNPAGSGPPNNMVIVNANAYDGGGIGDGNLTQVTQYVSSTVGDTRVMSYGYDFRDRRTSATEPTGRYTTYAYDNLDRLTQTQSYVASGSTLIGQSQTKYDDRGRVYQQLTYAVDPSTGTVGNALTANNWYDYAGNLIQQIQAGDGQVFNKSTYNGVGWVTATYRGFNPAGTSYAQATTPANDVIVTQTVPTYDEAGNVVSTAYFDRLNDTPASGTGSTGPLSYGTQPKARVSYAATWFDGIDRPIAAANYGAIASFTRPSTPPTSSDTILVSLTAYDDAGRTYQTTDPMGVVNQTSYDAAGRTTQTVEDVGGSGHLNRTTNYTYTLDDLIATLTAVNPSTGDQTTTYTYGTTLAASGVARNDLPVSIAYPDSVGGSDVVSYTYNRQGQHTTVTDQRGTVRTLLYDKLGRLTDDCVTTLGTGTDGAVRRVSTAYEVRGMVSSVTSYDNPTPGTGTVLNECAMTYNAFTQLVKEQQDHAGAVGGASPAVQYAYDTGAGGSNEIRLVSVTYPNGRVVTYGYGAAGGLSDRLSRLDAIQDGTTTLAAYTYVGG